MMLREMLSEINEQDRFAKVRNRTKQTDSDFDALLNRSPTVVPSTHHAVSGVETHKHVRNIEPNAAMIKKMGAINPNLKEACYNRGVTYYMIKEYDLAWADVHKVEELGYTVNPEFLKELKKASGRDR